MRSLLNPWVILAVVLAIVGAGGYGVHLGQSLERAKAAEQMSLEEKIQQTLATEVSKIHVTNTVVRGRVETITREVPVYRDCHHDPVVLGLLNDLLTGKTTVAPGDSVVPAADPVGR